MSITQIKKRDGRIVDFKPEKIEKAIKKALIASKQGNGKISKEITKEVIDLLQKRFENKIPSVEDIQDIVEEVLILADYPKAAKAYILYREQHRRIREIKKYNEEAVEMVDQYLKESDWEVRENSNMAYSLQGLNNYVTSAVIKKYWLNRIYPPEIRKANESGDFHIHDLQVLGPYCVGWDLYDLLLKGFGGVFGKIESKPPKHLSAALGQIVNFFYTLQGEAAGAVALSSFDTLLSPFVYYDRLSYPQVKQEIQEFLFNCNVPTRVGFQTPFTNLTLDLKVPEHYKNQPVLVGGKFQDKTYGEFQEEVNMINRSLAEVMIEGDAKGRPFTFPIPTYNVTSNFDWENPAYEPIWKMTAKYGIPYFANFINSDMKPEDVRSMCCRLRLSNKELYKRGGGLFGSNPLTGSLGVVTINLPRVGYLSKNQKEFFEKLSEVMDLAKESLEIKRKTLENLTEKGLYPYSKYYLDSIKKMRGKYWANHFSTIGLVGMNEALLNFKQTKTNIGTKTGQEFAQKVLDFMRERMVKYQEEDGGLYNLEATPAEGSLDPTEKILISQSDPRLTEIGSLIDKYLEKNKENVQFVGNSEVLKIPEGEMFTYGFNRKNQKIKKYPVTALVRHLAHSMYEIITASGRKVRVTGQHSVFTLNSKGEAEEILVGNLKEKDIIAIPKKIEMEEVNQELNLINIFKGVSFKDKLYAILPLNFIENLISNSTVRQWALKNYSLQWKDIKYFWKKNKVVPLNLFYDLNLNPERKILKSSKIFYRDTKNTKPINALIPLDRNFGFVVGCLLAEGWLNKRSEFTNTDKNLVQRFILAVEKVFGKGTVNSSSLERGKDKRKTRYTAILSKITGYFFEAIGLQGKSNAKKIPALIFFSPKDCVAGLLEGFHFGDGYVYQNKNKNDFSVRLYTNSKELTEGLNLCLLKLGILAKIRKDQKSKYHSSWKDNYILSITGTDNLKKYFNLVLRKKIKLENLHSSREIISEAPKLIKSLMEKYSLKPSQIGISKDSFNRNVRSNKISLQYLKKITDKLANLVTDKLVNQLQVLVSSNLYWDKIIRIRKVATPQYVYDLEVDIPGDQVNNFLGGEGLICLHNTSYRLALKDRQKYSDIITAGTKEKPYYTNSSQLPVNLTDDLFEALKLQDNLQTKYTGGTVFHAFLGEQVSDPNQAPRLIKKVFENFRLPYFTLTPTFSICPVHGYISGEHFICPKCVIEQPCEVYSRIVGYLRPVQQWNDGKKQEFKERKEFKI